MFFIFQRNEPDARTFFKLSRELESSTVVLIKLSVELSSNSEKRLPLVVDPANIRTCMDRLGIQRVKIQILIVSLLSFYNPHKGLKSSTFFDTCYHEFPSDCPRVYIDGVLCYGFWSTIALRRNEVHSIR